MTVMDVRMRVSNAHGCAAPALEDTCRMVSWAFLDEASHFGKAWHLGG